MNELQKKYEKITNRDKKTLFVLLVMRECGISKATFFRYMKAEKLPKLVEDKIRKL